MKKSEILELMNFLQENKDIKVETIEETVYLYDFHKILIDSFIVKKDIFLISKINNKKYKINFNILAEEND